MSRSAIVLDPLRAIDNVSDFAQLKERINEVLSKYNQTKGVRCTGMQRRAGEGQVKVTFESVEQAQCARNHDQRLQEPLRRHTCWENGGTLSKSTESIGLV